MRRRRFLAALGGSASLGLGGLLAYRASRTRTLSVASVETYDAALRLSETDRGVDDVERIADRSEAEFRALRSAIRSDYETDATPNWLAEFLDRNRFVRHEGAVYELSDTLPKLVVSATPVATADLDGRIADTETLYETIEPEESPESFLARARLGGVTDRAPTHRTVSFFEDYAGVRAHGRVYEFSADRRDPGPPYSVTAAEVSSASVRDTRSVALSSFGESNRNRLRGVLERERDGDRHHVSATVGLTDPPEDFVARLRTNRLLRTGDATFSVRAWDLSAIPLALSATVVESGVGFKNPGRIRFTLTNAGDRSLALHSGAPFPFGSLTMEPIDGGDERYLYPDAGTRSSMWSTRSTHGRPGRELSTGEDRSVEYAVGGDAVGVPPGEYVVAGEFHVDTEPDNATFPFRLALELA